jgi:hypothetical protein
MFTQLKLDEFVPKVHPLRAIRSCSMTRPSVWTMFARMHEADAKGGRPSIAPEKLV